MDLSILYNDFMSSEEKEFEISFMRESMNFEKTLLAYRSICEKEELDIMDAELRCMEENGDMDLLEEYYREASEASGGQDKKEGLLTRMCDFIRRQLEKIKNFLFGSNKKKSLDQLAKEGKDVGIDEDANKTMGLVEKAANKISGGWKAVVGWFKNDDDGSLNILKTVCVSLTGVGVAVGVAKHKVAATKLKSLIDKLESLIDDGIEKLKGSWLVQTISSWSEKAKENVQKGFNTVTGWLKKAVNWILSLVGLGKKHDEDETIEPLSDEPDDREGLPDKKDGQKKITKKQDKIGTKNPFKNGTISKSRRIKFLKKNIGKVPIKYKGTRFADMDDQELTNLCVKVYNKGGVFNESANEIDDIFSDLFTESDTENINNDPFDFDLPDDFIEESTEELDEISELLSSL